MKKTIKTTVAVVIIILATCTPALAQNRNLRENKSYTQLTAGVTSKAQASFSATHFVGESWNYGAKALIGENSQMLAFAGITEYAGKWAFSPAIALGIGSMPSERKFFNPINGDILKRDSPRMGFLLGGNLRISYLISSRWEIYSDLMYMRAITASSSKELSSPWEEVENRTKKNLLIAEVGIAYNIENNTMLSGDNCPAISVGGGISNLGAFATAECMWFDRYSYCYAHSYGVTSSFYNKNGDAEMGGKYMFCWNPGGSDGIYNASIGAEAVLGKYYRDFDGSTVDDPERLMTGGHRHSLGGGLSVEIVPLSLQWGRVNLAAFGGIGFRSLVRVNGNGDCHYDAGSSTKTKTVWKTGVKIEVAL